MSTSFEALDKLRTAEDVAELLSSIDIELDGLYRLEGSTAKSDAEKRRGLDELKGAARAVPRVKLNVAIKLPREKQEELWKTVKTWIEGPVVVEVKVNPKLLGGAQIEYQGKYYDGSIGSKVDGVLTGYAQI